MALSKEVKVYIYTFLGLSAIGTFYYLSKRTKQNRKIGNAEYIDLPDSDYDLSFTKYKSSSNKADDGILFQYYKGKDSSAKIVSNFKRESFNVFDKYKVYVDTLSKRPYFDISVVDLSNNKVVYKDTLIA